MSRPPPRAALVRLLEGPEENATLDRCALEIAAAFNPGVDVDHYLQILDLMAEHLALRIPDRPQPDHVIDALNTYLFIDEGFSGNAETYYDPRNSFLSDVLDRRTGIPVTLSILYIEIARRLGFTFEGVGLPGHFIVRYDHGDQSILLDPFNAGKRLSKADCEERLKSIFNPSVSLQAHHLRAIPKRRLLHRLLTNLKLIYLHAHDIDKALLSIDLCVAIDPKNPDEYRARAMLYLQLECFGQACTDFERYLELRPNADDRQRIQKYIIICRQMASQFH